VKPTVDQLMEVDTILSHSFCPDGTASAMICLAAYGAVGRTPEVKMVMYDTVDHSAAPAAPKQLWADITPPIARWQDWAGMSPIVLDHHETAMPVVEGLGGVYGGLDDSGASLAFKNVMRVLSRDRDDIEEWAKFAHLAMIRDTWKDAHEDWEEGLAVGEALNFYTQKALFISSSEGKMNVNEMIRFGKVLVQKTANKAFKLAQGTTFVEAGGLKYGFFNCTEKAVSETGHALLEKHGCNVAAGFFFTQEGGTTNLCVSLRSKKGEVPVNKIAEKFGGGGHQPAAGFRLKDAGEISLNGLIKIVLGAAEVVFAQAVMET
jgi:nanoRNase/pAp phosphatase (c-di-AMP/oligoRNAs hydrolase)